METLCIYTNFHEREFLLLSPGLRNFSTHKILIKFSEILYGTVVVLFDAVPKRRLESH